MQAMPESGRAIATNATPLIALAVASSDLDILRVLYERVIADVRTAPVTAP